MVGAFEVGGVVCGDVGLVVVGCEWLGVVGGGTFWFELGALTGWPPPALLLPDDGAPALLAPGAPAPVDPVSSAKPETDDVGATEEPVVVAPVVSDVVTAAVLLGLPPLANITKAITQAAATATRPAPGSIHLRSPDGPPPRWPTGKPFSSKRPARAAICSANAVPRGRAAPRAPASARPAA